jgi:hypothetical protein
MVSTTYSIAIEICCLEYHIGSLLSNFIEAAAQGFFPTTSTGFVTKKFTQT